MAPKVATPFPRKLWTSQRFGSKMYLAWTTFLLVSSHGAVEDYHCDQPPMSEIVEYLAEAFEKGGALSPTGEILEGLQSALEGLLS